MVAQGFHLMAEAGFCVQRIDVPNQQHFTESRTWVRPSLMLGLGYTLRILPWSGFQQRVIPSEPLEAPSSRHTVSLRASKAVNFIFPPTVEYRVGYAYGLRPRWDVYGGVEIGVSRWFFPVEEGRDSVRVLGGRLGMRFFPLGRGRLSYYADGSVALGKRLNGYFSTVGSNSKNSQMELGSGLRLELYKGLSADVAFFQRWFWVFPDVYVNREGESGVVFGLNYRFGGRNGK